MIAYLRWAFCTLTGGHSSRCIAAFARATGGVLRCWKCGQTSLFFGSYPPLPKTVPAPPPPPRPHMLQQQRVTRRSTR